MRPSEILNKKVYYNKSLTQTHEEIRPFKVFKILSNPLRFRQNLTSIVLYLTEFQTFFLQTFYFRKNHMPLNPIKDVTDSKDLPPAIIQSEKSRNCGGSNSRLA